MKKALLVIDAQEFFRKPSTKNAFSNLNLFLRKSARKYDDIIFLRYINQPGSGLWNAGWKGLQIHDPMAQLASEVSAFSNDTNTYTRASFSAFDNPRVEKRLKKKGIKHIDLAGFDTQCCVLTTAMNAFDKGYAVAILPGVTGSSFGEKFHKQALLIWKLNTG